jgi:hypothetical protein
MFKKGASGSFFIFSPKPPTSVGGYHSWKGFARISTHVKSPFDFWRSQKGN